MSKKDKNPAQEDLENIEKNIVDWEHIFEPFLNNTEWDEDDILVLDEDIIFDDDNIKF